MNKSVKIIIISVIAALVLAAIITVLVLVLGDKGGDKIDPPYNNEEEIDGSDDEHTKLY